MLKHFIHCSHARSSLSSHATNKVLPQLVLVNNVRSRTRINQTWQDRARIMAGCRDKIHQLLKLLFILLYRRLQSLKSSPDLRLSPQKET